MAKYKSTSDTLAEVKVIGKSLRQKVGSDIKKLPIVQSVKAESPKKLGRLATAASDATSSIRGAANMAFGRNQSKTTGGKVIERVARVGAAAAGIGAAGVPGSVSNYGSKIANATNKATGYVKKGTKAAASGALKTAGAVIGAGAVAAPVIAGQIGYKNRSAESTRTGIMNPGKGKANLGINFDKPFEKTAGRDVPLPDSSSLFNK